MINIIRVLFTGLLIFLTSFALSPSISAQEDSEIRVMRYAGNRTRFIIADPNGGPPPGFFFPQYSRIYSALNNESAFGPDGIVPCPMQKLNNITEYVTEGSLVDTSGNLLFDIFFGPAINTDLLDEEAAELAKFAKSGGVLYLGGMGWSGSTPGRGPEYNLLFQELGIEDRFNVDNFLAQSDQSLQPAESIITKDGSFGDVGPLKHTAFRQFDKQSLREIATAIGSKGLVFESRIGKGYLVVMGESLFVNDLIVDGDNMKYFLNMFALGCDKSWQDNSVVLDVPSFKQGLLPYDDSNPVWENLEYDHGNTITLEDCDRNGDGATMAECACALTTAAMVMNYHGVKNSPDGAFTTNPAILNLHANETFLDLDGGYKGFFGGKFNWYYPENFSSDAAAFNENLKVEVESREDFNVDRVKELVDEGKPVIVQVVGRWGIHWVVVKGYDPDDSRLIINDPVMPDPSFGEHAYLDENYSPVPTNSMVVYKQTSSDFRRLQFATDSKNHLLITDTLGNKTGYDPQAGQITEEIPSSEYILELNYGDPTSDGETPPATDGVYFLTIKLPADGEFELQILSQDGQVHPVHVYSSDTEGGLAGSAIEPEDLEESYKVSYVEETAGEEVVYEKIIDEIEIEIDIVPFLSSNVIIPHKWIPATVAILASGDFDVTLVDKNSLTFGKNGDEESFLGCSNRLIDVNRDRKRDLVCYFYGDMLGLDTGDTEAILKGVYDGEINFVGTDSVYVYKPWFLF